MQEPRGTTFLRQFQRKLLGFPGQWCGWWVQLALMSHNIPRDENDYFIPSALIAAVIGSL